MLWRSDFVCWSSKIRPSLCNNHMIRTTDIVAAVVMLVGISTPTRAQVQVPVEGTSLDVDVNGNIFVVDSRSSTLTLFDREMHKVVTAGGPGWENGRFDQPAGLWARNGLDVLVADYGNHRIQRFDRTLSFVSSLSTRDADNPSDRFGYPSDVALSRLGELFLCDTENSRIVKVNAANGVETAFGGFGGGEGRLQHPLQVEIGANDWVYVLDPPHILVYDSFGNFLTTLPDGVMLHPTVLFADSKGSMVVDGDSLFCFDIAHRPRGVFSLGELLGGHSVNVRSFVVAGGKFYALCSEGLFVVPDPRE
jgi:DNA-binding beta-propeller fold protein YncE